MIKLPLASLTARIELRLKTLNEFEEITIRQKEGRFIIVVKNVDREEFDIEEVK
jgi:hypothetical protein